MKAVTRYSDARALVVFRRLPARTRRLLGRVILDFGRVKAVSLRGAR
jgi:hypothetical protein